MHNLNGSEEPIHTHPLDEVQRYFDTFQFDGGE
jgi:hypothetical protein